MKAIDVRPALPQDLDDVSRISYDAYSHAYLPIFGWLPRPATEDYTSWIRDGLVWLACQDGKSCGVLVIEKHEEHLMVWSVAVEPAHHGSGVGKSLISLAERLAKKMSYEQIKLHTNRKMSANIALYTKAGYEVAFVKSYSEEEGHELVYMQKPIL